MANYENVNNVGTWFFHALIESSKLDLMSRNEEAAHQNKPRSCHQFESTFTIDLQGKGEFLTITHLEPEHTVLLFGVHVIDSDAFSVGEVDSSSEGMLFPTGPGIGPFLRPPVVTQCSSAFAIPDASNGNNWQTATLAAATNESGAGDWLLTNLGQPFTASGLDNYKAGLAFHFRIAGFDGVASTAPPANTNYYCFWHALGSVAAYL